VAGRTGPWRCPDGRRPLARADERLVTFSCEAHQALPPGATQRHLPVSRAGVRFGLSRTREFRWLSRQRSLRASASNAVGERYTDLDRRHGRGLPPLAAIARPACGYSPRRSDLLARPVGEESVRRADKIILRTSRRRRDRPASELLGLGSNALWMFGLARIRSNQMPPWCRDPLRDRFRPARDAHSLTSPGGGGGGGGGGGEGGGIEPAAADIAAGEVGVPTFLAPPVRGGPVTRCSGDASPIEQAWTPRWCMSLSMWRFGPPNSTNRRRLRIHTAMP